MSSRFSGDEDTVQVDSQDEDHQPNDYSANQVHKFKIFKPADIKESDEEEAEDSKQNKQEQSETEEMPEVELSAERKYKKQHPKMRQRQKDQSKQDGKIQALYEEQADKMEPLAEIKSEQFLLPLNSKGASIKSQKSMKLKKIDLKPDQSFIRVVSLQQRDQNQQELPQVPVHLQTNPDTKKLIPKQITGMSSGESPISTSMNLTKPNKLAQQNSFKSSLSFQGAKIDDIRKNIAKITSKRKMSQAKSKRKLLQKQMTGQEVIDQAKDIYKQYVAAVKEFHVIKAAVEKTEKRSSRSRYSSRKSREKYSKRVGNSENVDQIVPMKDQFMALIKVRELWLRFEKIRGKAAEAVKKRQDEIQKNQSVEEVKLQFHVKSTTSLKNAQQKFQSHVGNLMQNIKQSKSPEPKIEKPKLTHKLQLSIHKMMIGTTGNHYNSVETSPQEKVHSLLNSNKKKNNFQSQLLDYERRREKQLNLIMEQRKKRVVFLKKLIKAYLKNQRKGLRSPKKKQEGQPRLVSQSSILTSSIGVENEESSDESSSQSLPSQTSSNQSEISGNSIKSDDSYYEEVDTLEFAALNAAEEKDKKVQLFNQPMSKKQLKLEASKLEKIFFAADTVNQKNPPDINMAPAFKFFKNLPIFAGKMQKLNKTQIKICFERLQIKLLEQGDVVFRQGDPVHCVYLILMGSMILYDETIKLDHKFSQASEKQGMHLQTPKVDNIQRKKSISKISQVQRHEICESVRSEEIGKVALDDIAQQIHHKFDQKIGIHSAGDLIGSLGNLFEQTHGATAVCKSDCLVIMIDQDIIDILLAHRERMKREALSHFFSENIPFLGRLYTQTKIQSVINDITSEVTFGKGEKIIKESEVSCKESLNHFFLIKKGRLIISKVIPFQNQNGKQEKQKQTIMEIKDGDLIGEDALVYKRPQSYTVQVLSQNAQLYKIDASLFSKVFSRMVPVLQKLFDTRFELMNMLVAKNRAQLEAKASKLSKRVSMQEMKELTIFQSNKYQNQEHPQIERMLKDIYLRDWQVRNMPDQELKAYQERKLKQELDRLPQELVKSLTTVSVFEPKIKGKNRSVSLTQFSRLSNQEFLNNISQNLHFDSVQSSQPAALFTSNLNSTIFIKAHQQQSILTATNRISPRLLGQVNTFQKSQEFSLLEEKTEQQPIKEETQEFDYPAYQAEVVEQVPRLLHDKIDSFRQTNSTLKNNLETNDDHRQVVQAMNITDDHQISNSNRHTTNRSSHEGKAEFQKLSLAMAAINQISNQMFPNELSLRVIQYQNPNQMQTRSKTQESRGNRYNQPPSVHNVDYGDAILQKNFAPSSLTLLGKQQSRHKLNLRLPIKLSQNNIQLLDNQTRVIEEKLTSPHESPHIQSARYDSINQRPPQPGGEDLKKLAKEVGLAQRETLEQIRKKLQKPKFEVSNMIIPMNLTIDMRKIKKNTRSESQTEIPNRHSVSQMTSQQSIGDPLTIMTKPQLIQTIKQLTQKNKDLKYGDLINHLDDDNMFFKIVSDLKGDLAQISQGSTIMIEESLPLATKIIEKPYSNVTLEEDPSKLSVLPPRDFESSKDPASLSIVSPTRVPTLAMKSDTDKLQKIKAIDGMSITKLNKEIGNQTVSPPKQSPTRSQLTNEPVYQNKLHDSSQGTLDDQGSIYQTANLNKQHTSSSATRQITPVVLQEHVQTQPEVQQSKLRATTSLSSNQIEQETKNTVTKVIFQKADAYQRRKKKFNEVIQHKYSSSINFVSETFKMTHHKRFMSFDRHKERLFDHMRMTNKSAPWISQFTINQQQDKQLEIESQNKQEISVNPYQAVHLTQQYLRQGKTKIQGHLKSTKYLTKLEKPFQFKEDPVQGVSNHSTVYENLFMANRFKKSAAILRHKANHDLKTITIKSWNNHSNHLQSGLMSGNSNCTILPPQNSNPVGDSSRNNKSTGHSYKKRQKLPQLASKLTYTYYPNDLTLNEDSQPEERTATMLNTHFINTQDTENDNSPQKHLLSFGLRGQIGYNKILGQSHSPTKQARNQDKQTQNVASSTNQGESATQEKRLVPSQTDGFFVLDMKPKI